MKVYTKTGDQGTTMLLGGVRVPKHSLAIDTYGTVDELNSHIGLLRDLSGFEPHKELLLEIQDRLFTMGSHLAVHPDHEGKMNLPPLFDEDITRLEHAIDAMENDLEPMRSFVLPGGAMQVSHCHIARCVCRRAERLATALHELDPRHERAVIYLNRLSDYLFVLSRKMSKDLKAEEMPWKPRLAPDQNT
jgi:cob(I)alamin adenosyltransferase